MGDGENQGGGVAFASIDAHPTPLSDTQTPR